jgi:hypothetical protein
VTAGVGAAAGVALGFDAASRRWGVFVWTVTTRRLTTVGRIGGLTFRGDLGGWLALRRGDAGATWIRTAGWSDGGAAARGPPGSLGAPTRADMPTTAAIAPVISPAARTRRHVSLMFLPPSVDTSFKGSIGSGGTDLRGRRG